MSQDIKCISFVNPKGGTGKTTSCVSIGGSLAKQGKKVLIVDFDPRANATLALGIDSSTLKKSIYDVVLSYCGYNQTPITSVILETTVQNLHIAPSEPDLAVAEVLMQNTKNKSFILKQMIYIFSDIRKMARCRIDDVTIILTRYQKPNLLSLLLRRHNASQEVEMKLKQMSKDVFIVPESQEIYEAQKQGLPISHYAPESAAGKAYEKKRGALSISC